MGSSLSTEKQKYCNDLFHLLTENGHSATRKDVENLVLAIDEVCPWVPAYGTFNLEQWTKIGMNFQGNPQVHSRVLFTWCKVRACLKGLSPSNILFNQRLECGGGQLPPLPQILQPLPILPLVPSASPPQNEQELLLQKKPPDRSKQDNEDSNALEFFPTDNQHGGVTSKFSVPASRNISANLAAALIDAGDAGNDMISAFPLIRGPPVAEGMLDLNEWSEIDSCLQGVTAEVISVSYKVHPCLQGLPSHILFDQEFENNMLKLPKILPPLPPLSLSSASSAVHQATENKISNNPSMEPVVSVLQQVCPTDAALIQTAALQSAKKAACLPPPGPPSSHGNWDPGIWDYEPPPDPGKMIGALQDSCDVMAGVQMQFYKQAMFFCEKSEREVFCLFQLECCARIDILHGTQSGLGEKILRSKTGLQVLRKIAPPPGQ